MTEAVAHIKPKLQHTHTTSKYLLASENRRLDPRREHQEDHAEVFVQAAIERQ
jgi:hypothetical protein